MKQKTMDTWYMALLAMLCGVLLVMGMTGIGFIPLPVIKATTMHIPVILGAILLGPKAGRFWVRSLAFAPSGPTPPRRACFPLRSLPL